MKGEFCMQKKTQTLHISLALILSMVTVAALTIAPQRAKAQQDPNPGVVPVNAQYKKLSAEWWQWALSLTTSESPLFEVTGERACRGEQDPGNVFFLGGAFNASSTITRNIEVPAGTRLFFPLVNIEWDNIFDNPPLTVAQLYANAAAVIDSVDTLHATIDGKPVVGPFNYRAKSDPFCYTLPATDNLYQFFDTPEELLAPFACANGFCVCPAVSDGYWLLLKPLSPGQHTINFGASVDDFVLDITYNIRVVPRNQYPSVCP